MELKSKRNNTNCCVYGCHSKKSKDPTTHFHYFPTKKMCVNITNKFGVVEKIDAQKAWKKVLLMGKPITKHMRVCSKHFTKQDYKIKTGSLDQKISPRLKRSAVPSQNLPKKTGERSSSTHKENARKQRFQERMRRREQMLQQETVISGEMPPELPILEIPHHTRDVSQDYSELEMEAIQGILALQTSQSISSKMVDKNVQVSSGDFCNAFCRSVTSEDMLNSISGIPSFDVFTCLCSLVDKYYPKTKKIETGDCILFIFMKLKLALTFKVLSYFFKVSNSFCTKLFDEYVQILEQITKSLITWPSIEECRRNMPIHFEDFKKVRIVLDCTEFPVGQAKCLCCRIRTYSHYKKRQTIKVMVGVSPGGLITFVSKAYGGRASDKSIFDQSGLIEMLEPHLDEIMVDKGFLVDCTCENYGIKMIRPSFLRKKTQFSAAEATYNKQISKARVHVERVNQRLKQFNILNAGIPWTLVRHIDSIITICCGIVNIQNPIFLEDKYV